MTIAFQLAVFALIATSSGFFFGMGKGLAIPPLAKV